MFRERTNTPAKADDKAGVALTPSQIAKATAVTNPPAPASASNSVVVPSIDPPKASDVDPLLVEILSWSRDHNSKDELAFCDWLVDKLTALTGSIKNVTRMLSGQETDKHCFTAAFVVTIPEKARTDGVIPKSDVMFSCHIDTMASTKASSDGKRQSVVYDENFGHLFLGDQKAHGHVLGADDGVGVWIMLKMIEAKVPGTYVFHRGEERGCLGANAILAGHREWLGEFDVAVAFDRPNCHEVIATQGGQRCASDKFANAVAAALNSKNPAFTYKISHNGLLTDVKRYRGEIAEVINLGVGYWNHHSASETLDYGHAHALMKAVIEIDWSALPVERDPKAYDGYQGGYSNGGYGSYHGGYGSHKDSYTPNPPKNNIRDLKSPKTGKSKSKSNKKWYDDSQIDLELVDFLKTQDYTFSELLDVVETSDPADIARAMLDLWMEADHAERQAKFYRSLLG